MKRIETPWTAAIVDALNDQQQRQDLHPFTCGNDSSHRPLVATPVGWICPDCDYRQTWAWEPILGVELRPLPPDRTPRRKIDWTEDQRGVFSVLVPDAVRECAETSREATSFLIVGDRRIRLRFDDVTDDAIYREAISKLVRDARGGKR